MSNEEYTPDTGWVRYCYSKFEVGECAHAEQVIRQAQFDRWLNEQLARAWSQGAKRRNGDSFIRENYSQTLAKNPYRPEES